MLVNIAIGDAYGASFEFMEVEFVNLHNTATSYETGAGRANGGHYTDDTQMSLALAELMLERKVWTRPDVAGKFLEVFKRDPRPGYAHGFYQFLQRTNSVDEFLKNIITSSTKSGAAMRAAPLGILDSVEEVIAKSYLQASITHNTEEGINAAIVVALSSYFFFHKLGKKEDLPSFIAFLVPGDWFTPWSGAVSVEAVDCTKAALTAVMKSHTLQELLINSVSFTGDTDTVAAIAMGIVNRSSQFENDLPSMLYQQLENDIYGYDYLLDLDKKLNRQFGGRRVENPLMLESLEE